MSIKICFVTTASGSIDSFILPMVPALRTHGFSVTFVTGCMPGFREKLPQDVKVYDIPVRRGFDLKGTAAAARRFKNICKAERFDMVVYTTPNGALYGSIGSKAAGVPCRVLAQWGMRYVGFEGFKRKLILAIEKISCRKATDIRNVSEKNRALAISDKMYKPEKCKVLGEGGTIGVDLTCYDLTKKPAMRAKTREKYQIPADAVVYGFVGRLNMDKGATELLKAFLSLRQCQDNIYLMLLGGKDNNTAVPQETIAAAENDAHVIFCGQVPVEEVVRYMAAFDVLVHPTYREGFGMVLQEAAALELPTITTDIPGASEAIVGGVTGLLVKKKDVPTLCDAMEQLMDSALREKMGKAGRLRIEKSFERNSMIERICQDYLDIYHKRTEE